jgi:pyruvate,water dikinase
LKRFETLSNEGLPLEVQARQLAEWLQFFYGDYGIPMILAAQFAQGRIKSLFKQEANQAHDHLINLGVALPGNKTTEMGEWIFALASADEIQRCDSAEGFLADLAANRLSPEFVRQWDQYMAEFGFRCPREIDPATPRPKEQPTLLFEQLKSISWSAREQHAFFEKARAKRETAYQALYAMALKKGRRRAQALEKYFKTWVMLGGYRETPKHYVIKVIDQFRQCALKMGGGFAAAGRLDQPEQIFDLTITDIDRAASDPDLNLRDLAQQRSALIKKIKRSHQVARIIDSRGRIYYPPRAAAAEGVLVGVSISPGVVQGRVKVFKHATDKQLLPGEILVARATDPGWTPLFINARGILLEIGGALQHGAVLAREYGIPCVSGLDGVTELLKDGQLVEVDGSNGTVRVLG